jgi:hypothetical protein
MYRYTPDSDVVLRISDDALIPRGHRWWDEYEAWCAAGNTPEPMPQPTLEAAAAALTVDVQAWLDATAQGNGYDNIATCVSYTSSAIEQWKADALAATAWRDAVWQACFLWQQSALSDPPAEPPTAEQVIAAMPQPEAFGWVPHSPGALS